MHATRGHFANIRSLGVKKKIGLHWIGRSMFTLWTHCLAFLHNGLSCLQVPDPFTLFSPGREGNTKRSPRASPVHGNFSFAKRRCMFHCTLRQLVFKDSLSAEVQVTGTFFTIRKKGAPSGQFLCECGTNWLPFVKQAGHLPNAFHCNCISPVNMVVVCEVVLRKILPISGWLGGMLQGALCELAGPPGASYFDCPHHTCAHCNDSRLGHFPQRRNSVAQVQCRGFHAEEVL